MNTSDKNLDISSQVIVKYESLSFLTGQMREAAISGEWDQLIAIEQQCRLHVATMRPTGTPVTLDESARQRKIHIIKKILADDASIRQRTQLWMGQLQRIMQCNQQELRLHQAYGD